MGRTVRRQATGSASPAARWTMGVRLGVAAICVVVLVLTVVGGAWATSSKSWLRNQGFEQGLTYWSACSPVAGSVASVGAEGPAQFKAYAAMKVTVVPISGKQMLGLGIPKDISSRQVKGVFSARQTFLSDGRDLELSYRLFTYEHRSADTLAIEIRDGSGRSYGKVAGRSLPYKPVITLSRNQKYKDSGWVTLTVTNLPAGKYLTLSYTLGNKSNAAHDTWVYIDHVNRAPSSGTVVIARIRPARATRSQRPWRGSVTRRASRSPITTRGVTG